MRFYYVLTRDVDVQGIRDGYSKGELFEIRDSTKEYQEKFKELIQKGVITDRDEAVELIWVHRKYKATGINWSASKHSMSWNAIVPHLKYLGDTMDPMITGNLQSWVSNLSSVFPTCADVHLQLIDELREFSWFPQLVPQHASCLQLFSKLESRADARFFLYFHGVQIRYGAPLPCFWRSSFWLEQDKDSNLMCETNDMSTLLYFLRRLPLY